MTMMITSFKIPIMFSIFIMLSNVQNLSVVQQNTCISYFSSVRSVALVALLWLLFWISLEGSQTLFVYGNKVFVTRLSNSNGMFLMNLLLHFCNNLLSIYLYIFESFVIKFLFYNFKLFQIWMLVIVVVGLKSCLIIMEITHNPMNNVKNDVKNMNL